MVNENDPAAVVVTFLKRLVYFLIALDVASMLGRPTERNIGIGSEASARYVYGCAHSCNVRSDTNARA